MPGRDSHRRDGSFEFLEVCMKSPAFQFYPTDWLGSQRVTMLTLEEEGAYIRLVASCWQHGSIPDDAGQCARIIGKGCSTTVARVVQAMFQPSSEIGRLVHGRLESERIKQECWRDKSSLGGKKSAEMRANRRVVEPDFKQGACNHLATFPLPSPSPSPSPSPIPITERAGAETAARSNGTPEQHFPEAERPSWNEWWGHCKVMGMPEWYANDKFLAADTKFWRGMENWKSHATRCFTWWVQDGRPATPTKRSGVVKSKNRGPNI